MHIPFGIKDVLDILIVAFCLYQIYKLMKSSGTLTVFGGIVSVIVVWILVSQVLEMKLMGAILDKFISVGFIVIVILFQDDIRRFLVALGSNRGWKFFVKLFSHKENKPDEKYIIPIVQACMDMSRTKTGALIVIQKEMDLAAYIRTGEMLNAEINARLIENIFFKNSPLHDGAMIISGNSIRAAGCILPVAHDGHIPKEMGLRHRAGIGMSKVTDAIVIIVSEERGLISLAHNGKILKALSPEDLQHILLGEKEVTNFR
ncbi:MAG: diadenylate cyclase CdaA [Tannerella sp.]|jgi:uncharacterized protein (TIGR00159 family)|nr:diadenylate cyclase CdaA [Tannerella sp.]